MPELGVNIRIGGGADATKIIADLEAAVVRAEQRISGAKKGSRTRTVRETKESAKQEAGAYRESAKDIERSEQLVTRSKLRELAKQGDDQKRYIEQYKAAHALATAALEREVGKRGTLSDQERRQVESLALAMVNEWDRAERQKTRVSERENRQRTQNLRRWVSAGSTVASTASQAASAAHGAIQAPREELASVNDTLGQAFGEGGATQEESAAMSARVLDFAGRRGMDPATLARSLQAAQTQFSVLSGDSPEARRAALVRALRMTLLARDAQSDPEQLLRLGGALSGVGGTEVQMRLLRSAIGITRRGGVELGSLTAEQLGTIQSQMASAASNYRRVNPGASEADTAREMERAFVNTLAQLEVLAPRGITGASAGNSLRSLSTALHDPRTQGLLLARLRGEFGRNSQQVQQLFNFDRQGHATLREEFLGANGAESFGRAITTIAGGDPDRIRALLGRGTRRGDRQQVLEKNQRTFIAALAGQDSRGRTGWDALVTMREGAGDVTDADLARTRRIVDASDRTRLNREHVQAMVEARRPGQTRELSDQARSFASKNPIASAVAPTLVTGGAALAGGGATALISLGTVATIGTNNTARGRNLAGEELSPAERAGRTFLSSTAAAPLVGAYDAMHGLNSAEGLNALVNILPERIARELRTAPLQVTVDPHALVHQQTSNASGRRE